MSMETHLVILSSALLVLGVTCGATASESIRFTSSDQRVDGKALPARHWKDAVGNMHSYVDVTVKPGAQAAAEVVDP